MGLNEFIERFKKIKEVYCLVILSTFYITTIVNIETTSAEEQIRGISSINEVETLNCDITQMSTCALKYNFRIFVYIKIYI